MQKLMRSLQSQVPEAVQKEEATLSRTKLHDVFKKYDLEAKLSEDFENDLRAWKNDGHMDPHYVD